MFRVMAQREGKENAGRLILSKWFEMRTHCANRNLQTAYQLLGNRSDQKLAEFAPARSTHDQALYAVFANETVNLIHGVESTNLVGTSQILLPQIQRHCCESGFSSAVFPLSSNKRIGAGFDRNVCLRRNYVEQPDHRSCHPGLINRHGKQEIQIMQICGHKN